MNNAFVKSPEPVTHTRERRAILTIAVGTSLQWMFDLTLPTMRAYAERCGADLIVADDNWRTDEHPCFMKQIINSLWWRYDRVLYLDADIEIMPDAPNIFDIVPADKLGMYDEAPLYTNRKPRMQAYIAEYKRLTLDNDEWESTDKYYNAGMFICSKETNPHRPPVNDVMRIPTSGNYDNTYVNAMIFKHQIPVHELDWRWNRLITANKETGTTDMREGSYFVHYASDQAKDILRNIQHDECLHVHIVGGKAKKQWILEKMQGHIKAATPDGVNCDYVYADAPGHVNIFSPYRLYRKSKHAKDIVFFTHPEDMHQWRAAHECDEAVVMCAKYRDELIADGMDAARVHLIYAGVGDVYKDYRLRVLNPSRMETNENYKARKGFDTWQRLCSLPWLNCTCTGGDMTPGQVSEEYLKADVIVSTATLEGGPMACYEALSMGKPYYGRAGVGVHDETEGATKYASDDELECLLMQAYSEKYARAQCVKDRSWKAWATDWWKLIGEVAGRTIDANYEPLRNERSIKYDRIKMEPKKVICVLAPVPDSLGRMLRAYLKDIGYGVAFVTDKTSADIDFGEGNIQYFAMVKKINECLKRIKQ